MKGFHIPIFAVALLASLVLHLAVWQTTREVSVHPGVIDGPVKSEPKVLSFRVTLNEQGEPRNDFELPPEPKVKEPAKPPEPVPPPPAPPVKPPPPPKPEKPDVEKFPDRIGSNNGEGIGTHEAKGDKPLMARKANNDQPSLSLDPPGPGRPVDPSRSLLPPGDGGSGGKPGAAMPAPQVVVAPMPTPHAVEPVERAEKGEFRPGPISVSIPTHQNGVESDAKKIDEQAKVIGPLAMARPGAIDPLPSPIYSTGPEQTAGPRSTEPPIHPPEREGLALLPPPPPARPAMSPPPAPLPMRVPPAVMAAVISPATPAVATPTLSQQVAVVRPGNGGRPGAPSPAADPAQESDSEVDAFSKIETTLRRDGKLEVQFGRQVKTVRPKIPVSGMVDAALSARSVTLKVNIGVEGNVTAASIVKSSGSNDLDQPTLVAMYDWWFEPLKDKKGRPVPDVVFFTITFR